MPSESVSLQFAAFAIIALLLVQAALWLISAARRFAMERNQRRLSLKLLEQKIETARQRHCVVADEAGAWRGFRKFVVARTAIEGDGIRSVYLAPHDRRELPQFQPGKHLTLKFQVPNETKSVIRCYSISDRPNPRHYRITVKRAPPPRGTDLPPGKASTYINDELGDGDIIDVKAPKGSFFLDLSERGPVVLIGGGVGITPFLSMLVALSEQGFPRETWLFYGVRNPAEQVEKERLDRFAGQFQNFHLNIVYNDVPVGKTQGFYGYHSGQCSIDLLKECLPSNNYEFYICGPPPMMNAIVPALLDWGVPKRNIRFEAFGPASIKGFEPDKSPESVSPPTTGTRATVRFTKSGKSLIWSPEVGSLLDLGQRHGLHMNSGCCAGECLTCEIALVSGKVGYFKDPSETPDPGNCLPCVCVPQGDVEIDA